MKTGKRAFLSIPCFIAILTVYAYAYAQSREINNVDFAASSIHESREIADVDFMASSIHQSREVEDVDFTASSIHESREITKVDFIAVTAEASGDAGTRSPSGASKKR